jgi:polyisoprenoid-binding protein YceI
MGGRLGAHVVTQWIVGPESGELLLHTGVTGSAARMGHRLTIAMRSWQVVVDWDGDQPSAVEVTVELESLDVLRGEGGVAPLSGAEKMLVRSNALKTLQAKKFPQVRFRSAEIDRRADSFRLVGSLEICGRSGEQEVGVHVDQNGDPWQLSGEAVVAHTDYGIKQYSMLMGAMKVADQVRVSFTSSAPLRPRSEDTDG